MAWDDLSLSDKARMMKLAVDSGITDLRTIEEVYNKFAEGGEIHIKPENRGKFTALKERTGHSASWFKAHGTPAQKKMATFALNARKWHHAEGGEILQNKDSLKYINELNSYAIKHPEWFWGDSQDAQEARAFLYNNGAEDLISDIYNNTPENIQATIDRKKLPNQIKSEQYKAGISEAIDKGGRTMTKVLAATAAAPFAIEGLTLGAAAAAPTIAKGLELWGTAAQPSFLTKPIGYALEDLVGTGKVINGLRKVGSGLIKASPYFDKAMYGIWSLQGLNAARKAANSARTAYEDNNLTDAAGNSIKAIGLGSLSTIPLFQLGKAVLPAVRNKLVEVAHAPSKLNDLQDSLKKLYYLRKNIDYSGPRGGLPDYGTTGRDAVIKGLPETGFYLGDEKVIEAGPRVRDFGIVNKDDIVSFVTPSNSTSGTITTRAMRDATSYKVVPGEESNLWKQKFGPMFYDSQRKQLLGTSEYGEVKANVPLGRVNSKNITDAVSEYIKQTQNLIGEDGIILGSTRMIGEGAYAGIPEDTEFITTVGRRAALEKKLGFNADRSLQGVAGQKGTSPKAHGKNQNVDIAVIETNNKGQAIGKEAHEFFASMYPNEYREYMQQITRGDILNSNIDPYKLPLPKPQGGYYTDEEIFTLMRKHPEVVSKKTISDTMGITAKEKHRTRVVDRIFDKNVSYSEFSDDIKSLMSKYVKNYKSLADVSPNFTYDNVEANKAFLKSVGLPEELATDTDSMKKLIEDFWQQTTTTARGTSPIFGGSLQYDTEQGLINAGQINTTYINGSGSGAGGNNVSPYWATQSGGRASGLGATHTTVSQHPISLNGQVPQNPEELIEAINRGVASRELTTSEINIINDLVKKHKIKGINIQKGDDLHELSRQLTDLDLQEQSEIADKLARQLDIPVIRGDSYANSYIGKLYKGIPEAYGYSVANPELGGLFTGQGKANFPGTTRNVMYVPEYTLQERGPVQLRKEANELSSVLNNPNASDLEKADAFIKYYESVHPRYLTSNASGDFASKDAPIAYSKDASKFMMQKRDNLDNEIFDTETLLITAKRIKNFLKTLGGISISIPVAKSIVKGIYGSARKADRFFYSDEWEEFKKSYNAEMSQEEFKELNKKTKEDYKKRVKEDKKYAQKLKELSDNDKYYRDSTNYYNKYYDWATTDYGDGIFGDIARDISYIFDVPWVEPKKPKNYSTPKKYIQSTNEGQEEGVSKGFTEQYSNGGYLDSSFIVPLKVFKEGGPLPDLYQSKYQITPYYGPLSPETIGAAEREIENPTSPKAYERANKVLRTFTSSDVPSEYDFRYPYYEYVNRKDADDYLAKKDIDESYRIPYIPEKKITLTNAGKLNGVELSTNMLDSIAKYANLAQVPIDEGLGLIGYETNFGKFPGTTIFTPQQIREWDDNAKNEGRSTSWFINKGGVNPTDLANHHKYYLNSYNDAIGQIARTLGQDGEFIHDASNGYINAYIDPLVKDTYPDLDNYFKQGYNYADRTYVSPKDENPLKSAFEYYKTGQYNSKDLKHNSNVKYWGRQILNSPEIQKWLKSRKFSNGGNLNSGYIIPIEALKNREN